MNLRRPMAAAVADERQLLELLSSQYDAIKELTARVRALETGRLASTADLGTGAAATLGTVGGAGPTAAAQSTWVPTMLGGVPFFLPAWT